VPFGMPAACPPPREFSAVVAFCWPPIAFTRQLCRMETRSSAGFALAAALIGQPECQLHQLFLVCQNRLPVSVRLFKLSQPHGPRR
jgi:hypothetical protein